MMTSTFEIRELRLPRSGPRPAPAPLPWCLAFVAAGVLTLGVGGVRASQAYGTINNFDVVNDTGVPCHGFEIELDDIHSSDISYTFDYNHYGTPTITEAPPTQQGSTNAVFVRYRAVWTNTGWSAFTAVPTTNIAPTAGHQFTNPNINFGGEHFGVGYRVPPTKVTYFWLVDDGSHNLTRGQQVNISTPVLNYTVAAQPQAAAAIPAPILPLPPSPPGAAFEFSDATWVKSIVTTSHTNSEVKIGDLMTPNPDNPAAKDWRNGQPDQVEVEWQLQQIDFLSGDYNLTNGVGGPNGQLGSTNQNLSHSDDVVTTRYEYYAYVGPYADWDTHQALCETVGPDGVYGVGTYIDQNGITNDLSTVAVVGKFLGSQMSAMSTNQPIGLIDHLPDGEVGVAYPWRSVVIAGDTNFTATHSGTLPSGMDFQDSTGRIYGAPNPGSAGVYILTVTATAGNNPVLKKNYPFLVASGPNPPPHSVVDTTVSPAEGGSATGDGVYTNGTMATVVATPNPGFGFANWTENGAVVSGSSNYTFTNALNHSLVANFVPRPPLAVQSASGAVLLSWPANSLGFSLQQNAALNTAGWVPVTNAVSSVGTNNQVTVSRGPSGAFFRLVHP